MSPYEYLRQLLFPRLCLSCAGRGYEVVVSNNIQALRACGCLKGKAWAQKTGL